MKTVDHFIVQLKQILNENINKGEVKKNSIGECLVKIDSLAEWIKIRQIQDDRAILNSIAIDMQHSLIHAVCGMTESAEILLRRVLEISLSYVYFSAYPVQKNFWLKNKKDISWSEIMEEQFGVFGAGFTETFCPKISEEEAVRLKKMRVRCVALYRVLSETVHGGVAKASARPLVLSFDEEAFESWVEQFNEVLEAIHVALAFRFLPGVTEYEKQQVVDLVQDHLLGWATLRDAVGIQVQGENG